ncbi:MAG: hypothetical protein LKG11_00725 [Bacilli bacterium]|jgi:hypothetical protein|nr:hypothetical protein [Bacilli bacterium]
MKTNPSTTHAELTDQQITDIGNQIRLDVSEETIFEKFGNPKKWPQGRDNIQYRALVHTHVAAADVVPLKETVAPRSLKLTYATFTHSTNDYGTKHTYTAKEVNYNVDDVVADSADEIGEWAVETRNIIVGKAILASKCALTYDSTKGIFDLFRRAAIIAKKLGWKPIFGNEFAAITTPEVEDAITEELYAKTGKYDLPDTLKEKALSGYIGSIKHFAVHSYTCDPVLVDPTASTGGHYIIFMGKMNKGSSPFDVYSMKGGNSGIEVINNPLGSGVLLDEDGNITSDDNKQKGSVACNMTGFSAHIVDDRCILVAKITGIDTVSNDLAVTARTGYKSKSTSPAE